MSTKTVTRNAKRLVEMGVLEVKPKERGRGNIYITISIPELIAMKTSEKVTPKSEEKQGNGNGHEEAAISQAEQAKLAAATATDQSVNLAAGSVAPVVGQRDRVASNDDSGGNDDHHAVNPKQTANRVMAPLDDLRYWSDIGYEGMDDYGVMWGVSGDDLDNLIREHLKIREAEAEKNFKSQRAH